MKIEVIEKESGYTVIHDFIWSEHEDLRSFTDYTGLSNLNEYSSGEGLVSIKTNNKFEHNESKIIQLYSYNYSEAEFTINGNAINSVKLVKLPNNMAYAILNIKTRERNIIWYGVKPDCSKNDISLFKNHIILFKN